MTRPPKTTLVANGVTPPTPQPAPESSVLKPPLSGAPEPLFAIIERAARDPTVDIEKFKELMAMRERLEDRRAKQAFDNALALAKGEIGPIIKNREVDFTSARGRTHYRYEDFAAVAAAVDPVLARHGLSYRFRSDQQGPKLRLTCRVSHHDGYGDDTTLEANNDSLGNKNDIQALGSAATYLQRYTLKLALGLAAATDTDAKTEDPPADIDAVAQVQQLITDTGADLAKFLEWCGAPDIASLTAAQAKRGAAFLEEKKRRAAKATEATP